jgi:DNA-binding transcriptional ArsR family regulator
MEAEIENSPETGDESQPLVKWGEAILAGYQILPDALVRGQHLLKLSATDVVVIANLNQAWWFEDRLPYLQPHTIAKRMGVSERSVQRSLSRLRRKGLLLQVRQRQPDGSVRYYHDLSGLKNQLVLLARRDIRYSESIRKKGAQT